MKIQTQLSQASYKSSDGFVGRLQKLIKKEVIPYQYNVLCDNIEGVEKSHVVENFENAARAIRGEDVGSGFYGMVFQDSDAGKWIEAAAYSLLLFPDSELEKTVDELIEKIAAAQDDDGYLNTYFTVKDKDKRWTNLLEGHELYCSGHLMEAACAYFEATGKRRFLDVMLKNMEHIYDVFINGNNGGYPGHPEIELALMKLYRCTGDKRCYELSKHFIDVRGVDCHFFEKEREKRSWTVWGNNASDYNYTQSASPVREQNDAVGHAVRAVYLYTGMADVAGESGDKTLFDACRRLWESITQKRMYVTGGIGSTVIGEAFSVDYDLPSDTAYSETCAAIGLMFFASRMLENEVDSEYADIMERAFYNTVLSGMELDGKRFFYVNPLECVPGISGKSPTHRHDLTQRPDWYACACCPPNVARVISSFGKYAYGENDTTAYCHLYAEGTAHFSNGIKLLCQTEYPYGFTVNYEIQEGSGRLAVRIPSWSEEFSLLQNGSEITPEMEKGYAYFDVKTGDKISLVLSDKPYNVYASSKVPQLTGKLALCRGPLVYCFEGIDNDGCVLSLSLKKGAKVKDIRDGIVRLSAPATRNAETESLYSSSEPIATECEAIAVPYYTWANRGETQMRVWLDKA